MSHRDVLALWPSLDALHGDLRQQGVEIGFSAVAMWKSRDEIPSAHWLALVKAAAARGFDLTLERIASSQKSAREAAQ